MAQSKQSRVSRLLLKAVRSLPEKEQQIVLEYLVELGLSAHGEPAAPGKPASPEVDPPTQRGGPGPGPIRLQAEPASWVHFARQPGGLGPDHQMIPVRLAEPQHRLLKEWCAEHGFSMAVVVRGLVERFLEGQQERPA